ncbi:MAG: hypothetical protein PVF58_10170 [Candidatus Methanofastidiosia archaeon]|jgi:hypothetical protein
MKEILYGITRSIGTLAEKDYFKKVDKSRLVKRLAALAVKHPEIILLNNELEQRIDFFNVFTSFFPEITGNRLMDSLKP